MFLIQHEKKLFSIIVPAYNSAAFIRKCIDSVLAQTYTEFELILIDDGSNDDTLSICHTYAASDPRVKVIHKENGGHTSARNEGLRNASGEYVIFLDSDDWLSPTTVEACYHEIVACAPDIIVYRMQNSDNATPYPVLLPDGHYEVRELETTFKNNFILSENGSFTFPKSLSAKCFLRDVVYRNQCEIPQDIQLGEDGAAFIGSLLSAKRISVIASNETACYFCLVRSNSVSRSTDLAAFGKATSLLLHYEKILKKSATDYAPQFNRYVVAQLYTATLLVLRGGGNSTILNHGIHNATRNPVILNGLNNAKFNLKGYRFILKKFILRHRLWGFAKLLDRIG